MLRLSDPKKHHIEGAYHFWREKRVKQEIGKFFAAYALEQDVRQAISDKVIAEFVDPKIDPIRQKELGNFIMVQALGMSVEPLKASFARTKE